ncbi:MAG: hypothetical protein AAF391_11505 [Bacteroidota bacterium]
MKRNITITLFAFAFTLTCSQAQFFDLPKQKEAAEFKERSLIVQLMPQNEDSLSEYRKDEEMTQAYLDRLDQANETFKASIEKYWTMHTDIQFLKVNEIEPFFEGKDAADYVILDAGLGYGMRPEPSVKNIASGLLVSFFFAEEGKPLFSSMTLPIYLNDFMFEFYLINIQKYLMLIADGTDYDDESVWSYERNLASMEQNTLFIPEDALGMDEAKARDLYSLPMEFVSNARFANAVKNRESNALVPLVLFHMKKKIWMYVITKPSTMEIVSLFPVNSGMNFRVLMDKPGDSREDGFVETIELLSIKTSNGFDKQQFKAISHKGAFKLNY